MGFPLAAARSGAAQPRARVSPVNDVRGTTSGIRLRFVGFERRFLFSENPVHAFDEHLVVAAEMRNLFGDGPLPPDAPIEGASRHRFQQRGQAGKLRPQSTNYGSYGS